MSSVRLSFLISFAVCTVLNFFLVPALRYLKFGQTIREEGPKWHEKKSGTPTMGGIGFLVVSVAVALIFCKNYAVKMGIVFSALYGLIGFADDFIKIALKRNLGLSAKQKLALQILVTVIFLVYLTSAGLIETYVNIPFFNVKLELSWFYIVFITLFLIGFTNAVNLTDGLDGLAAGVTEIVALFFALAGIKLGSEVSVFASALSGALLGFLFFNFHPAKMFMGDTGSLFLGGAVAMFAILLKMELILVIVGIIYVVEAFSVIIQVSYYKKTRKRIFLMSPIHHHFEMKGMNEVKIVSMFSLVTVVACVLAYFII